MNPTRGVPGQMACVRRSGLGPLPEVASQETADTSDDEGSLCDGESDDGSYSFDPPSKTGAVSFLPTSSASARPNSNPRASDMDARTVPTPGAPMARPASANVQSGIIVAHRGIATTGVRRESVREC